MIRNFFITVLALMSAYAYAQSDTNAYIQVLGVAQDGGYPHIGCSKQCCARAWKNEASRRHVVSLALVNPATKRWWLFEATPDIKEQLHNFQALTKGQYKYLPDGIFITHAHIGHYTGLMELGREAMNTKDVRVYVMPKMKTFLETNGPWSQLVTLHNISLSELTEHTEVHLTDNIIITAFTVPHRDEYSETAGFNINTSDKNYVFIPDIDKWGKWDKNIKRIVAAANVALLDGTFYNATELPGRNMSEVPHPLVTETMDLFKDEDPEVKSAIYFIHFNHTNPLMWDKELQQKVQKAGYHIAREGQRL